MKFISRAALGLAALAFLAACQPATTSAPPAPVATSAKVVAVAPLAKSDIAVSGATSTPTDQAGLKTLVTGIMGSQTGAGTTQIKTLVSDLQTVVSNPSAPAATVVGRSISSALNASLTSFNNALTSFPTTKTATFSTDLSNESFGTYLSVTKAKADMTVNATTWDNLAVVMGGPNPPNIKSLSGSALGSFEASLNLTGVAAGPIKAVKLRANLGADASATFDKPVSQMTAMAPGNIAISVNYKASASVAFSVALADGTGGKIVVTANSALDKTKAYPFGPGITTPDFNIEFVTATVSSLTLDVYDDAGTLKFTKVYADATALMTDFAPAP